MNEKDFTKLCKEAVAEYANKRLDRGDGVRITADDIYIVWLCKTLQNSKAMCSSALLGETYYELTFNGDKNELYLDAYKKFDNQRVSVKENAL